MRLLRVPAVRAALIQALVLAPMLGLVYLMARSGLVLSLWHVALVQGALAAAMTCKARLATWWVAIELLFPAALLAGGALHWPPLVFLLVFLFLLGLYWSTFRTQVPFYPSGAGVRQQVAQLLPPGRAVTLIDIGSGLGGLVLDLARRRPESHMAGIELAPLPWLLSWVRARLSGSTARFTRGDYERCDFSGYDVVFAYLSPAAMPALWAKAEREMGPGAMLLSYEFSIPTKSPDRTICAAPSGTNLYVWYF